MSGYPDYRPRRLRRSVGLRQLTRETRLQPSDLILPLFVTEGVGVRKPVESMPGVYQTSVDEVLRDGEEAFGLGIPAVLLFGIPDRKDDVGSAGYDEGGVVQRAVRTLKRELPDLIVITDVCLCEYTSHGHCGVLHGMEVDNDATLPLLARMAVTHAAAGADIVAPSDMMDGRIAAIRRGLDDAGYQQTAILSYAAKYASAFYGPFREAAESTPQFGDRSGYQMDPANAEEALREVWLDIEEGADMIMVKPALPCLDIIRRVKDATGYPVVGYQVSGEFAMIMAAADRGWLEGDRAMRESLVAIRRAGADIVITYWARQFAQNVQG
ncbi:MAG TPA: porphobilinogen synthase [Longimicrobiaceae bacterium]|nr:porphobilinogen synthase [Longimicrobiaceae bacterium]